MQEFLKQQAVEPEGSTTEQNAPLKLSKKLAHLYGALKLPDGLNEEEARQEYLLKKHG